jgi:pimeloyl-ACP methyl ester carboxylesterase
VLDLVQPRVAGRRLRGFGRDEAGRQGAWPAYRAFVRGASKRDDDQRNAAWRTKPSFYAVSTQDRTINPDLERFMAKRMGAKTIEINASHLALISQPDAITNLIMEALAV